MSGVAEHYGSDYFDYQKQIGEFGGIANLFKFEDYISPSDTVLDFGCGGGFLLKNLNCKTKVGIEPNENARNNCLALGIQCYPSLKDIENGVIDTIISNHCLEHTPNPYELISLMHQKLKKNGKVILVVPIDSYRLKWRPNDIDNHLYSFSPMNIGNILQAVGFQNISSKALLHKWRMQYRFLYTVFGKKVFHLICRLDGIINTRDTQVRAIGMK